MKGNPTIQRNSHSPLTIKTNNWSRKVMPPFLGSEEQYVQTTNNSSYVLETCHQKL